MLAQQALERKKVENSNTIYECGVCRRSYRSPNSLENHFKAKKHRELESTWITSINNDTQHPQHPQQLFSDDEEQDDHITKGALDGEPSAEDTVDSGINRSIISCLFCSHTSDHLDANIHHMVQQHGFFLPDIEYLMDIPGLISYLFGKVVHDHICLYCNNRGKQWRSLEAVRAHMTTKGHCKMAYDDSEDPEALLRFYDFGPIDSFALDSMEEDGLVLLNDNTERLLGNGTRIGHRRKLRYFKQRLRKRAPDIKPPLTIEDKKQAVAELASLAEAQGNPLNRHQRRHLLLTSHSILQAQDPQQTLAVIQSTHHAQKLSARKHNFHEQVALKNNKTTTRRLRIQNPI
ncbi:hypothetical protein [Absidia glauca]|uniref:C2H2-type domain-containing protein n=1 Tax=Absidia glauca TaxID=4829 RepID=A0A163KQT4_ABSGL|nr:hypothetical protein [Absidia glauca]